MLATLTRVISAAQRYLRYAPYVRSYLGRQIPFPLVSDLDRSLPLPDLRGARIVWPNEPSWRFGRRHLEQLARAIAKVVPVSYGTIADQTATAWRARGGFPLPEEQPLGGAGQPKHCYDLRGELFEVWRGSDRIRCAYDYSDYPVISTAVLEAVDVYFKCTAPRGPLPPKVVNLGFRARDYRLLARARASVTAAPPAKTIDVYGRFGAWTDRQPLRKKVVDALVSSTLMFVGGFEVRVYPAYLEELMAARVAIELPGQGPISYRLIEALALGAVVVAPRPECAFPEPFEDGVHYIRMQDDGGDVVERCTEALRDHDRRAALVENGMAFFDHVFSPQGKVRRLLRGALGR